MRLKIEDILKPGSVLKIGKLNDDEVKKSIEDSRKYKRGKSIRFPHF